MTIFDIRSILPPLLTHFRHDLLSMPMTSFYYNPNDLKKIADWIEEKLIDTKYKTHLNTIGTLINKLQEFKEIYGWAQARKGEIEKETDWKAMQLFYRPRLPDKNDQRVFEGLERKVNASKLQCMRRNNALYKDKK